MEKKKKECCNLCKYVLILQLENGFDKKGRKSMLTEQRYEEISNLLEREGSVRTITLCNALQTSRETIRRDLENMEAKGMLRRIRGGAMKLETLQDKNATYTSFSKRREENLSSKESIALEAVNHIREGQAVALDSGTTALSLAKAIKARFHSLTVVTNSFAVAQELAGAEGITLVLTGGVYRADEEAFVSDVATLIFSKINVDIFFLTTCGISVERGITYQRMDEISVQNKMMEAADQTIVLADSSKIGNNSLVKMCGIEKISMVITDSNVADKQVEAFQSAGVNVIISKERNGTS